MKKIERTDMYQFHLMMSVFSILIIIISGFLLLYDVMISYFVFWCGMVLLGHNAFKWKYNIKYPNGEPMGLREY